MKLSNVLFFRALLFFALAAVSLVAGIPVPGDSVPATYVPIHQDIGYLLQGGWRRLRAPPDREGYTSGFYKSGLQYQLFFVCHFRWGTPNHPSLHFRFTWANADGHHESAEYDVSKPTKEKISYDVPLEPFDIIRGTWQRKENGEMPMVLDIISIEGKFYVSRKFKSA